MGKRNPTEKEIDVDVYVSDTVSGTARVTLDSWTDDELREELVRRAAPLQQSTTPLEIEMLYYATRGDTWDRRLRERVSDLLAMMAGRFA